MSAIKRVIWNGLRGISLYHTFSSSDLLKAGFFSPEMSLFELYLIQIKDMIDVVQI